VKWATVAKMPPGRKFVVCNADEGDPGAFTRIIHRPFGRGNAGDRQVRRPLDCSYRSHIAVPCAHLPPPRGVMPAPRVRGSRISVHGLW
jgi:hypothetical protein